MQTIKNLTNSPYDVNVKGGGKKRLPARGEITVDIDPLHLPFYRHVGYFQIGETKGSDEPKKPVTTTQKPADSNLEQLRADYTELTGEKPHHLWKEERLQSEIDKALNDGN